MRVFEHERFGRLLPGALLLVIGVALAMLSWLLVARADMQARQAEEERRFSEVTYEVVSRTAQAQNVLRGLQGVFAASDEVTRADFHAYASALDIRRDTMGLRALQFARLVPHAQRAAFETRIRRDTSIQPGGYPNFRILPTGDRPYYVATEFNEPMQGNENAFGFDTAFGPVRLAVLEAARDSGEQVASAPFALVQSAGNAPGVVIRAPVYQRNASLDTVAQRREAYIGQVSVVFVVDALVGAALGNNLGPFTEVTLMDDGPVTGHGGKPEPTLLGRYGRAGEPSWQRTELRHSQVFTMAGRFWRLEMRSTPPNPYTDAKALMAGGLVLTLTLLVMGLLQRALGQRDEAQARAAALIEATLTGIITVSDGGIIRSANRAACELFGYTERELEDRPLAWLVTPVDADAPAGDGVPQPGRTHQVLGRTRDNHTLSLAMMVSAVAAGADHDFIASFHDMSAQKQVEAQQKAFADELEATVQARTAELTRVNHELESFAYSVAHDLRAPVRHVHGFARVIETRHSAGLDERARDYLGRIVRASGEMGRLIDELLDFSRLGHRDLVVTEVDMARLVQEYREATQATLGARRVDWHVGALPAVAGDEDLLARVWSNLLGNALKYSSRREHSVIEVFADLSAADELRYCVRDNGVGLDMRYAHRLFRVFSRLHHADEFEGTGVGLANVRRIMERHGGRVWVESEPGAGAAFWFAFPTNKK